MKEGKPGRRQSLPENFHTAMHTGQWEASQDRVASMHNSSPEGLSSETPDYEELPTDQTTSVSISQRKIRK